MSEAPTAMYVLVALVYAVLLPVTVVAAWHMFVVPLIAERRPRRDVRRVEDMNPQEAVAALADIKRQQSGARFQ